MRRSRHARSGYALMVVLGYMMVLSIFATVFLKNVLSAMHTQQLNTQQVKTRALAESAIHHAATRLASDGDYVGESDFVLGDGAFTVSVLRDEEPDLWVVTAVASLRDEQYQSHHAHLRATLQITASGWVIRDWDTRSPAQREDT
ncbi:MAG: hypothetical protein VCD00_11120 [Candidatus Hydrogenedentota bacterium]